MNEIERLNIKTPFEFHKKMNIKEFLEIVRKVPISYIPSFIPLDKVCRVYDGEIDTCMCGCSGKYYDLAFVSTEKEKEHVIYNINRVKDRILSLIEEGYPIIIYKVVGNEIAIHLDHQNWEKTYVLYFRCEPELFTKEIDITVKIN